MPRKSETPHEGGETRNQLGGWLRDLLTLSSSQSQAIPDMIALHIGEQFCAQWAEGGNHGDPS